MKPRSYQRVLFPSSSTKHLNPYQNSLSSSRKKTAQELESNVDYIKQSLNEDLNNQPNVMDSPIYHLAEKEKKIIESRERLKNIHHFYRIRIEEQRNRNIQRNEIFIGIIQELQKNHNEKIIMIQNSLQQMSDEKKDINYVDQRMGSIKNTVQDILAQSKQLKQMNEGIEKQIQSKEHMVKEKESQLVGMKEELDELRYKLQQFQRLKLKENKRNKEMIQMIETTI